MKKANFFIRVDLTANFLFALLWFFYPKELLKFNFESKSYDDIHIHFSKVLAIMSLTSGMISHYALNKNCPATKAKILSIKLLAYILLLFTMIVDNLSSNLMSDKHVAFGMFGIVLLIMNCYLGLRSLKKYIRIKPM